MARPRLVDRTPEEAAKRAAWRSQRVAQGRRDADRVWMAQQVALDAVMGRAEQETAAELRVSVCRVSGMRTDPRVKEMIEDLRQYLRERTLLRAAEIHDDLYDGVALAIKEGDGREVDSWTRAAASMERVRQSASGEQTNGANVNVYNANVAHAQGGAMTGEQLAALLQELGIGRGRVAPLAPSPLPGRA